MVMPTFKELRELLGKGLTIEAQKAIVALEELHLEAREENVRLKEENARLKSELALRSALEFESPHYWNTRGDGKKDGPFCQVCYDSGHKLVRLQAARSRGWWDCKVCKNHFTDSSYSEPSYHQITEGDWRTS